MLHIKLSVSNYSTGVYNSNQCINYLQVGLSWVKYTVAYCNLKNGASVQCFVGDVCAIDHKMNLRSLENRNEIKLLSLNPVFLYEYYVILLKSLSENQCSSFPYSFNEIL